HHHQFPAQPEHRDRHSERLLDLVHHRLVHVGHEVDEVGLGQHRLQPDVEAVGLLEGGKELPRRVGQRDRAAEDRLQEATVVLEFCCCCHLRLPSEECGNRSVRAAQFLSHCGGGC